MPGIPRYVVQCFDRTDTGLDATRRVPATDVNNAISVANTLVPAHAGAAVLCFGIDPDTDRVWTLSVLERVGDVPDNLT